MQGKKNPDAILNKYHIGITVIGGLSHAKSFSLLLLDDIGELCGIENLCFLCYIINKDLFIGIV